MPTICTFYGIFIRMYYDDHAPPHFHVYCGGDEATIAIHSLEILSGGLPRRALAMVLEWAIEHRPELLTDWTLAEKHQPLANIEPLR